MNVFPLLIVAVFLGFGCAAPRQSEVHEMHAFQVHATTLNDFSSKPKFSFQDEVPLELTGGGFHFEIFQDAAQSVTLGLDLRQYAVDSGNGEHMSAVEYRTGYRRYLNHENRFQPFLQGVFILGIFNQELYDGVEIQLGAGAGVGISWYLDHHIAIEALASYEWISVSAWVDEGDDNDFVLANQLFGPQLQLGLAFLF